ncbi:MAG: RidA family protein [Gammaproteobacteria bacterium]|nr:RidA family protein [Gammaproteobacteria bacterium]
MNDKLKATLIDGKPKPLANYPHIKRAGDYLFVSGTSSRKADNSFAGVEVDSDGRVSLDIKEQTRAVIENIESTLRSADAGLEDLVELSCFLISMDDFPGFNEIYNEFFDHTGPARTTIAVHQLPLPHLLVEIKAIAYKPL